VNIDLELLLQLRRESRSWQLLRAAQAPFILCFLQKAFTDSGRGSAPESELISIMQNLLFKARDLLDEGRIAQEDFDNCLPSGDPQKLGHYLTDWTDRFWLSSSMPEGSDEPWYDLTPDAQTALNFVQSLQAYSFVGTESKFLILLDLLKQLNLGTIAKPDEYLKDLKAQRKELDRRIAEAEKGLVPRLDERQVKERFQQFSMLARSLLSDFRTVEYNMRGMYRKRRIDITQWSKSKGELIGKIFGESASIEKSDQGRSVQAFSDLLLNPQLRAQLSGALDTLYELPAVRKVGVDHNLRRLYPTLLDDKDHIQATIALLSKQLRRFIDDRTFLENARLSELISEFSKQAVAVAADKDARKQAPDDFFELELPQAQLNLPLERPMFSPRELISYDSADLKQGQSGEHDADILTGLEFVDTARLRHNINTVLNEKPKATLCEILERFPLELGLEEVLAYLQLAFDEYVADTDEGRTDEITWNEFGRGGPESAQGAVLRRLRLKHVEISRRKEEPEEHKENKA
jgi:hypothetical protein